MGSKPFYSTDPCGLIIVIVGDPAYVQDTIQKLKMIANAGPWGRFIIDFFLKYSLLTIEKWPFDNWSEGIDPKHDNDGVGTGTRIHWNNIKPVIAPGPDGEPHEAPPEVGLGHEIGHAVARVCGTQSHDRGEGEPRSTPPEEEESLPFERWLRKMWGNLDRPWYWGNSGDPERNRDPEDSSRNRRRETGPNRPPNGTPIPSGGNDVPSSGRRRDQPPRDR